MKITSEKNGDVKAKWTEVTKWDVTFPKKTWLHLKKLRRGKNFTRIITWCYQNGRDLDPLVVFQILDKGPEKRKKSKERYAPMKNIERADNQGIVRSCK